MKTNRIKTKYSPRLLNGDVRIRFHSQLPDSVKDGLRDIARRERKSMSWVIEEVIIDYFGLKPPKYKTPPKYRAAG